MKNKREERGVSLNELSSLSKIKKYKLQRIEEGVLLPSKREKNKIIILGINGDEYNEANDLGYPYVFEKATETKKESRLKSFISKKIILLISLFLTFAFLVASLITMCECIPGAYNNTRFYEDNIVNLRSKVIDNGNKMKNIIL